MPVKRPTPVSIPMLKRALENRPIEVGAPVAVGVPTRETPGPMISFARSVGVTPVEIWMTIPGAPAAAIRSCSTCLSAAASR